MTNFFVEPVIVKIKDKDISITPLAVKNISKAARAATPLMEAFKSGEVNPLEVFTHADAVIELVAIATGETEEWIGELDAASLLEILTNVVSVNANFFSQSIVPQVTTMMKAVQTITPKGGTVA